MGRRDAAAAVAVLALAAFAAYESTRLAFGKATNPGPGFLPWWAALGLGVLSLVLLLQALTSPATAGRAGEGGRPLRVLGLVAVLGSYVALLEPLGFVACTFLLVVFMLRAVDPYRWPTALGAAALAAVGSYLVFATWLSVPLPPGLLAR